MTNTGEKRKKPSFDPYELLKLEPGCDERDIDIAYKKLALQWHPDKNPDRVQKANEMFRRIYEAYDFLKDKKVRKEYEEEALAKRRRAEYDYQQKQSNSKRRQELIDRLKKKEAAVEKPERSRAPNGWTDNRRQATNTWWSESNASAKGGNTAKSSGGSARWDAGDDEELERLKREGAEMLRRDREEMERRMREEANRVRREKEARRRNNNHTGPVVVTLDDEEGEDGNGGHLNRPASTPHTSTYATAGSTQAHSMPSAPDLSLDDFLRFEQEVLNFSAAQGEKREE